MTDPHDDGPSLPSDHWVIAMGLVLTETPPQVRGDGHILASMLNPETGRPRLGILATLFDLVGGHVPDGTRTPTIDLRAQVVGPLPTDGEIVLHANPKKVGRRLILSEVVACDAAGRCFATGTTTFMNQLVEGPGLGGRPRPNGSVDSFEALVGARVVDDATLEVDAHERVSNGPYGTVQGGAQAFLAELAAEHVVATPGAAIVDLDIRYLNRLRAGPLRARASATGAVGPLIAVQVSLTDAGHENRTVSHVSLLVAMP